MFIYLFILFCTFFMGFMFFLIKTAPYGVETEDGIRLFKNLENYEKFMSSLNNENERLNSEAPKANIAA